ncbi:MAG: cupin domain-containing protein, partial [Tissierellaceae bacterium]
GRTKEDHPQEGEEFGYVISGTVFLHLGRDKYRVKRGESFYYKANSNHYLKNTGKSVARIIWVSTPPSF